MSVILPDLKPAYRLLIDRVLLFQPLFSIPVYFTVLRGIPPYWVSLPVAFLPLALRFLVSRRPLPRTSFDIALLIFMMGMFVGLAVSPDKAGDWGAIWSTVASILVFYGFVGNSQSSNRYWIISGSVFILITLGMAGWFFSQGNGRVFTLNRWLFKMFSDLPQTGVSLQQHGIGLLLSVIIPMLFALSLFSRQNWLRFSSLFFSGLFLVLLALVASGTAWVAMVIALVFVLFCYKWRTIFIALPVAGLLTAALITFYDNARWLRVVFSTESVTDRINIWYNTIKLFDSWQSLVTGLGLGDWYYIYMHTYDRVVLHIHNTYLQIYADTGILGLIAIIIAAGVFFRLSVRIIKSPRAHQWYGAGIGLTGSLLAGAIFSLLDVTNTGTELTTGNFIYLSVPLIWIVAGFFVAAYKKTSAGV